MSQVISESKNSMTIQDRLVGVLRKHSILDHHFQGIIDKSWKPIGESCLVELMSDILSGRPTRLGYHQIRNSVIGQETIKPGSVVMMAWKVLQKKLNTIFQALSDSDVEQLDYPSYTQIWNDYVRFFEPLAAFLNIYCLAEEKDALGVTDMIKYGVFYEAVISGRDDRLPLFDPVLLKDITPDLESQMVDLALATYHFSLSTYYDCSVETLFSKDSTEGSETREPLHTCRVLLGCLPVLESIIKKLDSVLLKNRRSTQISRDDSSQLDQWSRILHCAVVMGNADMVVECYVKYLQPRILRKGTRSYTTEMNLASSIFAPSQESLKRVLEIIRDAESSASFTTRLHTMKFAVSNEGNTVNDWDISRCTPHILKKEKWEINWTSVEAVPPPCLESYLTAVEKSYLVVNSFAGNELALTWDYSHGQATFEMDTEEGSIEVKCHMLQALVVGHFVETKTRAVEELSSSIRLPEGVFDKVIASLVRSGLFSLDDESGNLVLDSRGQMKNLDLLPYFVDVFEQN